MDPEQLSLFEVALPRQEPPRRHARRTPEPDPGAEPVGAPGPARGKAAVDRLRHRLDTHLAGLGGAALGSLTLTDNRSTVLSSRPRDGGSLDVRLHWSFASAPEPVLAAVARVVGGPRRGAALRRAREVVRGWIADHRQAGDGGPPERLAPAVAAQRRPVEAPQPPRGRVHDLVAIRDEVNRRYFGGRLEVDIAWSRNGRPAARRRRSRTGRAVVKLGSWSPQDRTVRIHPVLDHHSVPHVVVASVVHHELLHADLEPEVRNGRRRLHTPEFRRRERGFAGYEEARGWIDRHLNDLVRRRARL